MYSMTNANLSPDIIVGRNEHHQLLLLALANAEQDPANTADWLLSELDRAMIVADQAVPPNTVRMQSLVRFRTGDGTERTVKLVYPGDADIADGRVSALTPVGAALIGLRERQSITYRTRDGRKQVLTVLQVVNGPDDDVLGALAA